jgi:CheY-like chemotaxis protein
MSEKKKILIVEDETLQANAISEYLIGEGYEVKVANNGQEGLKTLENYTPNLILMDILMPIMDGIATLKEIKSDPKIKDIPVIVLTNLKTEETMAEAEKLGAAGYLFKINFKLEDLLKKVKEIVGN